MRYTFYNLYYIFYIYVIYICTHILLTLSLTSFFVSSLLLSLLSCFFLSLTSFNIFPEAGISQCYMLGITQEPNSPPPWDVISSDRRNRNEVGTPVTADLLVVAEKNTWGGARSSRGKNASDQALLWWSGKASLKKWLLHQGESKDPCEPCLWQEGVFTTGVIRAEALGRTFPGCQLKMSIPLPSLTAIYSAFIFEALPGSASWYSQMRSQGWPHYHFLDLSYWIPSKSNFSPVLSPSDKTILRKAETNDMHPIYSAIIVYNYIKDAMCQRRSWRDIILAGRPAQASTFNTVLGVLRTDPRVWCLYRWAKPSVLTSHNSE